MKEKSERNKTITLNESDIVEYSKRIFTLRDYVTLDYVENKIFNNDLFESIKYFPDSFVDLLILDPPYNLDKNFGEIKFNKMSSDNYYDYLESWFPKLLRLLKPTATVYMCGDWKCSSEQYRVLSKYCKIRNRITWQREKGRGSKNNWKNCSEDIFYATINDDFYFNVDAIKIKKKVIAPYKENGIAKDWVQTDDGKYRLTYPSNFINDVTVPYWSMPENTEHPTQKPEKLIAKLILSSCPENGFVFDPFSGSGTTAAVCKKLNRKFSGLEIDKNHYMVSQKRLDKLTDRIQGYEAGSFLERNSD